MAIDTSGRELIVESKDRRDIGVHCNQAVANECLSIQESHESSLHPSQKRGT